MPRVNHENSSNDSAEGEPECIGAIGSIHHEATLLPVVIWEKIIDQAIDMFPETCYYLCDVNKLFPNIVDRTASCTYRTMYCLQFHAQEALGDYSEFLVHVGVVDLSLN